MTRTRRAAPAAFVFLALVLWACNLADQGSGGHVLSLIVEDSLAGYSKVRIVGWDTTGRDTIETFWNDTLPDPKALRSLKTRTYRGGDIDISIEAMHADFVPYRRIVHYRPGRKTRVDTLPGVYRFPDTTAPVLDSTVTHSLRLLLGSPFTAPAMACVDDRDGALTAEAEGAVDPNTIGTYVLTYGCRDKAGNAAVPFLLSVEVRRPPVVLPFTKETQIDSGATARVKGGNYGFTPFLGFGIWEETFSNSSLLQFDLSKVDTSGLKSAKAVFSTFGWAGGWDGVPFQAKVHICRMRSAWEEGTGNWYFFGGKYTNGGNIYLANYQLPQYVMDGSDSAYGGKGVQSSDYLLVDRPSLIPMDVQTVTVAYDFRQSSNGGPVPKEEFMVPLELDFTDYVKTVPPDEDFGFVVSIEGTPGKRMIAFLTKEIGDGTLGPKLILSY